MKSRFAVAAAAFALALGVLHAMPARAHPGKVLAELPCPVAEPMGLAAEGETLWIADLATRTVAQLRTSDGAVVRKLDAPGNAPTGVAWLDGTLFLADRSLDWIGRVKSADASGLSPIQYYEQWATGLVHDGRHLWVVNAQKAKIHEVDPKDGTTIGTFEAPASAPTGIAFDGAYLWVADHGTNEIYMVDRKDGGVRAILPAPGPYPSGLAISGQSMWVSDYQTRRLYRVALPDDTPYLEDQERRVHVSFEVTYRAKGKGRITHLVSYLAIPVEIPGQHILSELEYEPKPSRFETDQWGQKAAVFELGDLEPGQMRRVRWEADFALFRTRFPIVPERVDRARAATAPKLDAYLGDDVKYDLGSPEVSELADKLAPDKKGTYGRARAVFDHLAKIITYDRAGGWNNAAAVLRRGTGSCSEYTFALVALLRKAKIPARYVGAISERGDEASFDDVFHRWAEAYVTGYGWVPLDANAAHGRPPGERAAFFGGRSNRHVVTTIGGGGSRLFEWTYNNNETYGTEAGGALDVQPMGRYRPLEHKGEVKPHAAPRVVAPLLVEPEKTETASRWDRGKEGRLGDPWMAAIAIMAALGVGVAIGRIKGAQG
jgi:transglutaminase-like putative cysteine protease